MRHPRIKSLCISGMLICLVWVHYSAHAQTSRERWCQPSNIIPRALLGDIVKNTMSEFAPIVGRGVGFLTPAPSLKDVFDNCIGCRLNAATGQGPGCDESWGDPHLVSRDGLRFDFQAHGDFIMLEADDLLVQVRFLRTFPNRPVSFLRGVAIRYQSQTIVFGDPIASDTPTGTVTINGVDHALAENAWHLIDPIGASLHRTDGRIRLSIPDTLDASIHASVVSPFNLSLADRFGGQTKGLHGNGDGDPANDLQTADGLLVSAVDFAQLYGPFAQSWQVDEADSLFNNPIPASQTSTSSLPPTLDELDATAVADAHQLCIDAGTKVGAGLDECIYDVALTGDATLIEQTLFVAEGSLADSISAVAYGTSTDVEVTLAAPASVTTNSPVAGAGVLISAFEVDRFLLNIPDNTPLMLQTVAPCQDATFIRAAIVEQSGAVQEHVLRCDTSIKLPDSGPLELRVYDPSGGTGNYAFNIAQVALVDLGTLILNTNITGSLQASEQAQGIITAPANSSIYIDVDENISCDANLEVLNQAGDSLYSQAACLDSGVLVLDDQPPYQLRIGGTAIDYAFQLIQVDQDNTQQSQFGVPIQLTTTTQGQTSSITIPLVAERRYYIDVGAEIPGSYSFFQPDNSNVSIPIGSDILHVAEQSGEHTLTFDPTGDTVGTVNVTIHEVAPDLSITIANGDSFELDVTTPGQKGFATFDMSAGDSFEFDYSGTRVAWLRVLGPDGEILIQALASDSGLSGVASMSGLHQLEFDPLEESTGKGIFVFRSNN